MRQLMTNNRRGAYIVILALIFPACLFVMGALIDIGLAYATRARLQDVADAAALSGAQSLGKGDIIANDAARFYFAGKKTTTYNEKYDYWITTVSGAPDNLINATASRIEFSEDGKMFSDATDNASKTAPKNRYVRVSLSAYPNSFFLQYAVKAFNMDPLDIPTITVQSTAFNQGVSTIFSAADLTIKTLSATISNIVHANGNLKINGLQKPTRPDDISASGNIEDSSNILHNSQAPKQSMPKITQYTAEGDTSKLKPPFNSANISLQNLVNEGFTTKPNANNPNVFIVADGNMTITCDTEDTRTIYATFYAPNGKITLKGADNSKAYTLDLCGSIVAKEVVINLPQSTFKISPFEQLNPPAALVR